MGDYGALNGKVCSWLHKEGFMNKHKEDEKTSNLLLSGLFGGVARIPHSAYGEFLELYATDISNGVHLHFTECRGENFKMYMDIDLVTSVPWTDADTCVMAGAVQAVLRRFYVEAPDSLFQVAVCTAPTVSQTGGEKHGIHLVFPNMTVTREQALTMREPTLMQLWKEFSHVVSDVDAWKDIVDRSVYSDAKSGIRMIGSNKLKLCPSCSNKGELRKACTECSMRGKVDAQRPYSFLCILGSNGKKMEELSSINDSIFRHIRLCSIRTSALVLTPGWLRYDGCPSYIGEGDEADNISHAKLVSQQLKGVKTASIKEFKHDTQGARQFKNGIALDRTDKRLPLLMECIQGSHMRYANIDCKQVTFLPDSGVYVVKVHGDGCNYCQNKQADHKSNTVFFQFDKSMEGSFHQRCWSRKQTVADRVDGECLVYRSRKHRVSRYTSKLLWPDGIRKTPATPMRRDSVFKKKR